MTTHSSSLQSPQSSKRVCKYKSQSPIKSSPKNPIFSKNPDKLSVREEPTFHSENNIETSRTKLVKLKNSVVSLLTDSISSFCPEINPRSRQLTTSHLQETIHQRLYYDGKSFKRCKSYKNSAVQVKQPIEEIDLERVYRENIISKAENIRNCVVKRRNLSISQRIELKFRPTTCKFNFELPRSKAPIENFLYLDSIYKKSSRCHLLRKYSCINTMRN